MMDNELVLSWMWSVEDGINALRIDSEAGMLRWYDAIGCACDDSTVDQLLTAYVQGGAPSQMLPPPCEISAEINKTVHALLNQS